jgi:hypothetical protein
MKFAKSILTGTGVVVLAGMFLAQAQAQVTYTYVGYPFNVSSDGILGTHVTVALTVPTLIPPSTSFENCPTGTTATISNGVTTITAPPFAAFGLPGGWCLIATDYNGNLLQWAIGACVSAVGTNDPSCAQIGDTSIFTVNPPDSFPSFGANDSSNLFVDSSTEYTNRIASSPGTWSGPNSPPTTHPLVGASELLSLVTGLNIMQGTSLTDQLNTVLVDLNKACSDLTSFANHVRAQTGKAITSAQAATILQWEGSIAAAIPCPAH